jgi:hypothetical protein
MQNHFSLSPAQDPFEELRQNEDTGSLDAGSLDAWPAPREAGGQNPVDDAPASAAAAFPKYDGIPELTPELVPRRSAATNYGDLAAIIRLQSTEIERLALENDRLSARMDAVHQQQETEQNQRRDLEQRLREANARSEIQAPAFDVEEIRRAAREGMSAEIKPVLVAILDLLESTLSHTSEAAKPVQAESPVPTPIDLIAEIKGDFRRLPDILTRPLEELTSRSGNSGSAPDCVMESPAPAPRPAPRFGRPGATYKETQPRAIPSIVPWTNLFS